MPKHNKIEYDELESKIVEILEKTEEIRESNERIVEMLDRIEMKEIGLA